jgi:hypothetical protein
MGYAAQHPGGQYRFGVSATVASAVLYGAVVLFGLGSASSSSQGRATDRSSPVVRVAPDRAVSRPGKRLPQVSPGPARRPSRARVHRGGEQVTTVVAPPIASGESEKGSTPPTPPQPKSQAATTATSKAQSSPPSSSTPDEPKPIVTVPDLPVTVPDLPVTVPTSPLPLPLPPTPSVQVPATPSLPLP